MIAVHGEVDPTLFFLDQVTCPVSKTEFQFPRVRTQAVRPASRDSDFHVCYHGMDPTRYGVVVCPTCAHAAYFDDFTKLDEDTRARMWLDREERIAMVPGPMNGERSEAEALVALELAMRCYEIRGASDSRKAVLLHRRAWMERDAENESGEREWLVRARDAYRRAFGHDGQITDESAVRVAYLVGDLSMRLGGAGAATGRARLDEAAGPAIVMTGRAGGRSFTFWLALAAIVLGSGAFAWPASPASPPTADKLLVADLRGQSLIVQDPHRNEVHQVIPMPGGPHELLRLPDGRIAVSIEQSGLIAFVDVGTSEVELLDVGGVPHGLALGIEEAGDLLLVTDRAVDLVRRFGLGRWQERTPVAVDAWPHAVATLPNGALAVANAGAGTLQIGSRRIETGAVTETVAVSAAGFVATASAFEGTVWLFDALGDSVERYEVGGRPVRVVYSPDGDVLAAARSASRSVAVIEAGEVREFTVAGVPDGLAFSSDGRWLYVSDVFGGAVTVIDLASGEVEVMPCVGEATGAILLLER